MASDRCLQGLHQQQQELRLRLQLKLQQKPRLRLIQLQQQPSAPQTGLELHLLVLPWAHIGIRLIAISTTFVRMVVTGEWISQWISLLALSVDKALSGVCH